MHTEAKTVDSSATFGSDSIQLLDEVAKFFLDVLTEGGGGYRLRAAFGNAWPEPIVIDNTLRKIR